MSDRGANFSALVKTRCHGPARPWTSLTATKPRAGFYGSSRVQARAALLPAIWFRTASGRAECRPEAVRKRFPALRKHFPALGSTFPAPEARSRPREAPSRPPDALFRPRKRFPALRAPSRSGSAVPLSDGTVPIRNHCSAESHRARTAHRPSVCSLWWP